MTGFGRWVTPIGSARLSPVVAGLVVLAAFVTRPALADLPVHCVHRDILGTWELLLSESDGDSSATCGHVTPDRIMTMVKHNVGPANPNFPVKRTLTVELKNPNIVVGPEGREGWWTAVYDEAFDIHLDGWNYFTFFRYSPKHAGANPTKAEQFNWHCNETVSGWYHLKSAPRGPGSHSWGCFVARQVVKAVPLDSEEYSSEAVAARGGMVSGEMVLSATVMTKKHKVESRFAELDMDAEQEEQEQEGRMAALETDRSTTGAETTSEGARTTVEEALAQMLNTPASASAPSSFLEVSSLASSTVSSDEAIMGLQSREAAQAVVDRINNGAERRLWRAAVPEHLLGISHDEARKRMGATSKDFRASTRAARLHHQRNAHSARHSVSEAEGEGEEASSSGDRGSVRSNRRLAGKDARGKHGRRRHQSHKAASFKAADLSPKFGKHQGVAVDISSYPKCLDWSTVEGGKYIPDVLDQGHCGSCYAAAATDAITARARIKSKGALGDDFALSVQSVVQCSGLNQGCDGGYPYLVGKFGHEVGFVTSQCMKYTAKHDVCPAKVECANGEVARYRQLWEGMNPQQAPAAVTEEAAAAKLLEVGGKGALRGRTLGAASGAEDNGAGSAAGPLSFQPPQFRQSDSLFDAELEGDQDQDLASTDADAESVSMGVEGATANTYALSADRLYVRRYEYVGGFYGAGSESAMIKELQDGPLIVALNAPGDLFYYHGGIYHHDEKPEGSAYDVTPISRFEKTNHAVLLVGYCEEEVGEGQVVKYWKLKNSWSRRWGEVRDKNQPKDAKGRRDGGYFRMVRGSDTLAVESMAVVIDP